MSKQAIGKQKARKYLGPQYLHQMNTNFVFLSNCKISRNLEKLLIETLEYIS